jgi:predicted CoA-binding protein
MTDNTNSNAQCSPSVSSSSPASPAAPPLDLAPYQDERTIRQILHTARTVAIVGLSPNPLRASNFVGFYLQRHGYHVVPVNPNEQLILGQTSYPSLDAIPFPVDVVDAFRAPSAVPGIAEAAVRIKARALWLQFGVISPEGAAIAEHGGLKVVMDRCMKVEHARHLGRMHWYGLNTGIISNRRLPVG